MQRFSGERLRQRREAAGRSRELLAHQIGRSFSSVQLYEREAVSPPLAVICQLASVLGCDVADFFEEADRVAS